MTRSLWQALHAAVREPAVSLADLDDTVAQIEACAGEVRAILGRGGACLHTSPSAPATLPTTDLPPVVPPLRREDGVGFPHPGAGISDVVTASDERSGAVSTRPDAALLPEVEEAS